MKGIYVFADEKGQAKAEDYLRRMGYRQDDNGVWFHPERKKERNIDTGRLTKDQSLHI